MDETSLQTPEYRNHTPASRKYSESSLSVLNELIHQRTGYFFQENQLDRLMEKLSPRVAERGIDSLLDYYYLLKYSEDAEEEWRYVESALAVNETYFWREFDQIKAVAEILVPQLLRERPGQSVRIWHAACASGEEPYSMAIALAENGAFLSGSIEIIATDINEQALARARAAVYRPRSFRSIPASVLERYFVPDQNGDRRLIDALRSRVQFAYLNLVDEDSVQKMRDFDIIFCRNVFIYFSNPSIRRVAESFYNSLQAPGYLFVAAAESLLKVTTLYELVEIGGAFAYRK